MSGVAGGAAGNGGVPEPVFEARATLGEGPVWWARERLVVFVDIKGGRLLAWPPDGGTPRDWPVAEPICWLVERTDGDGFVAGLRRRVVHLRLDPQRGPEIAATLAEPEADLPGNRFNDAKADGGGFLWFGSMEDREENPTGALWRMDPAGAVTRIEGGYGVANGPAVSPDGGALYHTDSAARTIYAFDRSERGELTRRRVHIRFPDDDGYPDGMACDAEGGLWVAHWSGGRVTRFRPDGSKDRSIALPRSNVTSVAFFGDRLERLAITTARIGREEERLAGALFVVDPGVVGAPVGCWGRS